MKLLIISIGLRKSNLYYSYRMLLQGSMVWKLLFPLFSKLHHDHNHHIGGRGFSPSSQCRTAIISSHLSRASLPRQQPATAFRLFPMQPPFPLTSSVIRCRPLPNAAVRHRRPLPAVGCRHHTLGTGVRVPFC